MFEFNFLRLFDDSIHVRVIGIHMFDFKLFDDSVHVKASSVAQQSSADAARIASVTLPGRPLMLWTACKLATGWHPFYCQLCPTKGVSSYSQHAGCLQSQWTLVDKGE